MNPNNNSFEELNFKISTALKNTIGRDLINDRFIAVFELVKNSYDAGANNVVIEFENIYSDSARIIISDDGHGMSLNDIKNKWLFVAYSEKKHIKENDYRHNIRRHVAGAKGVGRFSCDRLGSELILQTKPSRQKDASQIYIDWDDFELDDQQQFMEIKIEHKYVKSQKKCGTELIISNLRELWKRNDLLMLKRSLMKLINPSLGNEDDEFNISIVCKEELENDKSQSAERDQVNGLIKNDILEKLNIKTTSIHIKLSGDGNTITTTLNDRGEFIFEIVEKNNDYKLLKDIDFSIFYLNRSAKFQFTSSMGIQPVNYGSIFVYKNGFRIYPFGQPGYDIFDIDRRKQQGYRRYLGTRDLMGRIQILGENMDFTETTSRDGGFIHTPAVEQLAVFFKEKVIKTLEKYVVDTIIWGDPTREDYDRGKEQGLMPKDVVDKIVLQFADFARRGDIISVRYSDNIIEYINNVKEQSLDGSISKLEKIGVRTNNDALISLANKVRNDANKLIKQKDEAEQEKEAYKVDLEKAKNEIDIRKKQVYFLKKASDKNSEHLLGGMHSILRGSDGLKKDIRALSNKLYSDYPDISQEVMELISSINLKVQKIRKISDYGISGNFSLQSDRLKDDIGGFIKQYIDVLTTSEIHTVVSIREDKPYICSFNATSIGMIIDNVASNSVKASATQLIISIWDDIKYIYISFKDNGKGLNKSISNTDNLFELGYSTTKGGFGMGLYHVKKMLQSMNGTIRVNQENNSGFELIARLKNEH